MNFLEVGAQGAFKSLCKEKQVGFFIVHINDEKNIFLLVVILLSECLSLNNTVGVGNKM